MPNFFRLRITVRRRTSHTHQPTYICMCIRLYMLTLHLLAIPPSSLKQVLILLNWCFWCFYEGIIIIPSCLSVSQYVHPPDRPSIVLSKLFASSAWVSSKFTVICIVLQLHWTIKGRLVITRESLYYTHPYTSNLDVVAVAAGWAFVFVQRIGRAHHFCFFFAIHQQQQKKLHLNTAIILTLSDKF